MPHLCSHVASFAGSRTREARSAVALAAVVLAAGCAEPTAPAVSPASVASAAKIKDAEGARGGRPLYAVMDGFQPLPNDKADRAGSGTALFTINPGHRQICATVTVRTALQADITEAMIHPAVRGAASAEMTAEFTPVLAPGLAATGAASGCVTLERDVIDELMAYPERFYFNIHTPYNGIPDGGILRGQLSAERP
jgi:hypothetical protein